MNKILFKESIAILKRNFLNSEFVMANKKLVVSYFVDIRNGLRIQRLVGQLVARQLLHGRAIITLQSALMIL